VHVTQNRFGLSSFLGVIAALALSCAAQAGRPAQGFAARADAIIRQHVRARTFSGVVLIADEGRPVFRKAVGLANREWNVPMTPDAVFRIGSTTKTFTAAAILRLAEQGKLSLEDHIAEYYPAAPAAWSQITLRHLLTHTSGIPNYVETNGFIRGPARLKSSPDDLVALVRNKPLQFPPGSKFYYSNTGYVLLGMVIQKVSGKSYAQYLADAFFKPLALAHTAYDDLADATPHRVYGYWRPAGVWENARLMTPEAVDAAGALRSTADDLLAWDQALHRGGVLSPAWRQTMFIDDGHGYGLGSFVGTRHGHRLWDHGGNVPGFCSAFEYYPDDRVTVIVLDNVEGRDAEKLASELAAAYFGWSAN
jgi:CubicO group peptidase (beta-lactamase class C family)